jgi:hypothetical protein
LPNSGHKISFKELQQQDYVMQNVWNKWQKNINNTWEK